ncbi:hypothetical protein NLJ89_g11254 [Agrocybe chaxingu]|uniref:Uncharacterized protein n=1 Tax=Agrocybe chaxingu TaxID=84603 RepID=A0A9W8JSQ9_9AGAR|nr:hypothetical protein NLJ89_g11254 [Agrocybe chaxingu]
MIAKFHSAPGHSMETTLTINIPPPGHVRSRSGRLKAKEVEEVRVAKEKADNEKEQEMEREKEKYEHEQELLMKEQLEREHQERERRTVLFHKMREKYDKVTLAHETHERELEMLNAKVKKMQAENDLLLDAVYLADAGLYYRYFPESDSPPFGSVPLPPSSGRTDMHYLSLAPASHITTPPQIMATSTSYASSSDPYAHSGLNSAYLPAQPHVEPSPSRQSAATANTVSFLRPLPASGIHPFAITILWTNARILPSWDVSFHFYFWGERSRQG